MDEYISTKQKEFLFSIIPNTETFVNKFVEWPLNDIKYLKKKDFNRIMEYLNELGCYVHKSINVDNYIYETIQEYEGMSLINQRNIFRNTSMKVIRLHNILVLDWDTLSLDEIITAMKSFRNLNFRIYKTTRGYHAYCTNKMFSHKDYRTLQLMKDLKCDDIYVHFVRNFGFIIRAQKKYEMEPYIEKFEVDIVNYDASVDKKILSILKLKDSIISIETLKYL